MSSILSDMGSVLKQNSNTKSDTPLKTNKLKREQNKLLKKHQAALKDASGKAAKAHAKAEKAKAKALEAEQASKSVKVAEKMLKGSYTDDSTADLVLVKKRKGFLRKKKYAYVPRAEAKAGKIVADQQSLSGTIDTDATSVTEASNQSTVLFVDVLSCSDDMTALTDDNFSYHDFGETKSSRNFPGLVETVPKLATIFSGDDEDHEDEVKEEFPDGSGSELLNILHETKPVQNELTKNDNGAINSLSAFNNFCKTPPVHIRSTPSTIVDISSGTDDCKASDLSEKDVDDTLGNEELKKEHPLASVTLGGDPAITAGSKKIEEQIDFSDLNIMGGFFPSEKSKDMAEQPKEFDPKNGKKTEMVVMRQHSKRSMINCDSLSIHSPKASTKKKFMAQNSATNSDSLSIPSPKVNTKKYVMADSLPTATPFVRSIENMNSSTVPLPDINMTKKEMSMTESPNGSYFLRLNNNEMPILNPPSLQRAGTPSLLSFEEPDTHILELGTPSSLTVFRKEKSSDDLPASLQNELSSEEKVKKSDDTTLKKDPFAAFTFENSCVSSGVSSPRPFSPATTSTTETVAEVLHQEPESLEKIKTLLDNYDDRKYSESDIKSESTQDAPLDSNSYVLAGAIDFDVQESNMPGNTCLSVSCSNIKSEDMFEMASFSNTTSSALLVPLQVEGIVTETSCQPDEVINQSVGSLKIEDELDVLSVNTMEQDTFASDYNGIFQQGNKETKLLEEIHKRRAKLGNVQDTKPKKKRLRPKKNLMKILGNPIILREDEDKQVEAPLSVGLNKETQNDESLIDLFDDLVSDNEHMMDGKENPTPEPSKDGKTCKDSIDVANINNASDNSDQNLVHGSGGNGNSVCSGEYGFAVSKMVVVADNQSYHGTVVATATKETKASKIGISVCSLTESDGLIISKISETSIFADSQLKPGLLLVSVNGISVADMNANEAVKIMKGAEGKLTIEAESEENNCIAAASLGVKDIFLSDINPEVKSEELLSVDSVSNSTSIDLLVPSDVDGITAEPPRLSQDENFDNVSVTNQLGDSLKVVDNIELSLNLTDSNTTSIEQGVTVLKSFGLPQKKCSDHDSDVKQKKKRLRPKKNIMEPPRLSQDENFDNVSVTNQLGDPLKVVDKIELSLNLTDNNNNSIEQGVTVLNSFGLPQKKCSDHDSDVKQKKKRLRPKKNIMKILGKNRPADENKETCETEESDLQDVNKGQDDKSLIDLFDGLISDNEQLHDSKQNTMIELSKSDQREDAKEANVNQHVYAHMRANASDNMDDFSMLDLCQPQDTKSCEDRINIDNAVGVDTFSKSDDQLVLDLHQKLDNWSDGNGNITYAAENTDPSNNMVELGIDESTITSSDDLPPPPSHAPPALPTGNLNMNISLLGKDGVDTKATSSTSDNKNKEVLEMEMLKNTLKANSVCLKYVRKGNGNIVLLDENKLPIFEVEEETAIIPSPIQSQNYWGISKISNNTNINVQTHTFQPITNGPKVSKNKSCSLKRHEDGLISFALDGANKMAKEQNIDSSPSKSPARACPSPDTSSVPTNTKESKSSDGAKKDPFDFCF
eukprot:CAMPEP_0194298586 /NCGR_PEP_ID=MMETSP0169-20130528/60247_1 /TAXON_ID=218684 /ORGANISM="Corethron pennatum, Strain L29A3" /LENGTH=1563 /DNA_ID=CAMNT_0039048591 /DNA_START=207 /DNA_END=4898 /DNA_ORIENTATION=+